MTDEEMDDAMSEAYVALYAELRRGGVVSRPIAWLAEVSYRRAADAMRRTEKEDTTDPDDPRLQPMSGTSLLDANAAAFHAFEALVDRLTPEGVRAVMGVVVGAYKDGVRTLTNAQIAEILGENPVNVKKWRQRGFQKLARLLLEEGLVDANLRLAQLTSDPDDDEEND
jgi:DNA-directed RNA polymerase specialized sigma24 family protein